MIRKMLVIAASAVIPMTGLVGAVAIDAGTAGAAALVVAPATCVISGSVAFGGGITASATTTLTNKTSTSITNLTGAGTNCQATPLVQNIVQKSAKCSTVTLGAVTVEDVPLTPRATTFPGCAPTVVKGVSKASKNYESGSAWGFVGGVLVNGVATSTTGGILTALKKGVPYSDNGVALTLVVAAVNADTPGGLCGAEAGFSLSGTVKKATTHTWSLNLCLSDDTGAGTTGAFLSDIASEAIDSSTLGSGFADGISINTAIVDPLSSTLVIS